MTRFAGATGILNICLLFCLSLGLLIPALAGAATGDLDMSFDLDGIVNQDLGSNANDSYQAVAIQNDGKIVAVGYSNGMGTTDVVVARYMFDGALDTSFGGTGIVYTDIGGHDDAGYDVAIQSDNKIVVVGTSGNGFVVIRFNNDGTLDTSGFGSPNGCVTTTIGTNVVARSVAIQRDGKIVVAGSSNNGSDSDIALVRFDSSGAPDFSVTTDLGEDERGYALGIQSDGKIVVAGDYLINPGYQDVDFLTLRYTTAGALDESFGSPNGYVRTDFGSGSDLRFDTAYTLGIQRDGRIMVAGVSYSFLNLGAVARYNQDGSLDPSFSGDGKLVVNFGNYGTTTYDLAFQSDGKIVMAAGSYREDEPTYRFTVARLWAGGSMDNTFGTNGVTRIDAGYYFGNDEAHGVAIQRDGNIVAVGKGQFEIPGSFDTNQNALVMRFEGDTAPP